MALNTKTAKPADQTNSGFIPSPTRMSFGLNTKLSLNGTGGEAYEKLFTYFQERCKELSEDGSKYTAVKMLKNQFGLNYSGIAIALTANGVTSAHVLMVEKTGDYPDKVTENVGGVRYDITRTPGDGLDEKYMSATKTAVADACRVDADTVIVVDGTLVPNEFDFNSESSMVTLGINTFNSIYSEAATRDGYKGINITEMLNTNRGGKFMVNIYYNADDTTVLDQTGLPVRQDICVALSYKVNNNGDYRSVNQSSDTIDIIKTYGYVDFDYTGPQIINGMMTTQKFLPNFVITHMDASTAPTPDILMLGVASVLSLNEDMNWLQSFRPSVTRKGDIDLNDIGALNIEGNIENAITGYGKKYDTKSKTFNLGELNKLVQTLVRPNMMISIDVPKAGAQTWYTSILTTIKFTNSVDAINRVNGALESMTNGSFQHNHIPMFVDVVNKIHSGYYKTKDGYRDIRCLSSYLAVANFVNDTNQPQVLINQYTNTLYNASIPSEFRAAERRKILDEMSAKTTVYKSYFDRLTFNGRFLSNMVQALRASGFNPMFANNATSNDMFAGRRSTVDFSNAVLGADVRVMSQSNAYGGYNNPYGYTRSF